MALIRLDKSMIAALLSIEAWGLIREAPLWVDTKRSPRLRASAQMRRAVVDLLHCAKGSDQNTLNGNQESSPLLINGRINLN
jgi:hypothetical protein